MTAKRSVVSIRPLWGASRSCLELANPVSPANPIRLASLVNLASPESCAWPSLFSREPMCSSSSGGCWRWGLARSNRGGELEPDGIFGPQTDQAVRQFQAAQGLAVDGVVGSATWARLGQLHRARRENRRVAAAQANPAQPVSLVAPLSIPRNILAQTEPTLRAKSAGPLPL
ncbi:MAG: peptidoglycan-binding protein [Synechococcales cyanobacterium RM1_1_8]|nr:peptidoglycan-binding protein [Synechococcales cyanobacterium RM1_1_8]